MLKHLIIIGVGGFAREVYWHAQDSHGYGTEWDLKGFLDGDVKLEAEEYEKLKLPVLGDVNTYEIQKDDVFICAVAEPSIKKKLVGYITKRKGRFINLIHKTAIVHGTVKMGIGNIISSLDTIHDHVVIGDFVTINNRSGLGHDARIGDYSSIMGLVGISGGTRIGKETYWATNSIAMPNSKIDDGAFIGVASVVFRHVKENQKVFGNPAMPI